jgi:integrase
MPNLLTEAAIAAATRRAATSQQRITLADPGQRGLQLRITPHGTRSWILYCRDSAGRPRRFPLGAYPEIGLAQARRAASAMREGVRQGADPIADARQRRVAARTNTQSTNTLRTLIALYGVQKGNKLRAWDEYQRRIQSVFAPLLDTALAELRLGALQLQADRWPAPYSAALAARYLRPILKWASAPGRAYVAKDLIELTASATTTRRERVLDRDELARLLPVLNTSLSSCAAAMRFILLTMARRQEVAGLVWREVDLARSTWTLPAVRAKSARAHVVPLSHQARALLQARRPETPSLDALVFAAPRGGAISLWDYETKKIMAASGTSGWHRHDLRRTGATLLGELGIEPHIIEAALNHTSIHSPLAATYNRSRYRPQVADALQRLADALDGIAAGAAVVVPLPRSTDAA